MACSRPCTSAALLVLAAWLALFVVILVRFRAGTAPPGGRAAARLVALRGGAAVLVGDVVLLAGSALPVWRARAAAVPAGAVESRIARGAVRLERALPRRGRPLRADQRGAHQCRGSARRRPHPPDGKDDIVLIDVLQVPRGRPVVVYLEARDVIHGFTLPRCA